MRKNKIELLVSSRIHGRGFTLIEMLIVIAIIIILVGIMVGVAKRIEDQSKERLCKSTIAIIGNALEQFRDFGYEYKEADYAGLAFPLDCSNFYQSELEDALYRALGDTFAIPPSDPCQTENSGSEALYFILSRLPDCRKTLDKVDKSLLTNKDKNGTELNLEINPPSGTFYPLIRFIDPWGTTLHYDYYDVDPGTLLPNLDTKKTFPVVTSAGPDKQFGTSDDISNRKSK